MGPLKLIGSNGETAEELPALRAELERQREVIYNLELETLSLRQVITTIGAAYDKTHCPTCHKRRLTKEGHLG